MNQKEFLDTLKIKLEEFYPIIENNNNPEDQEKAILISYGKEAKTIVKLISYDEYKEFINLFNFIYSYGFIEEKYSKKYIQNSVFDLLHGMLSDKTTLRQDIKNFYDHLKVKSTQKWRIIAELENITVEKGNTFRLIDSTVKLLDESDLQINLKKAAEHHVNIANAVGKTCICTTIEAGEINKANILATANFKTSLNLLRLFIHNINPSIKGTSQSGIKSFFIFNEANNIFSTSSFRVGQINNDVDLDNALYSYLEEMGVNSLTTNSSIVKVVKGCLYWLGNGIDEEVSSAKLVDYVTILESTLKRNTEMSELKLRVQDRCALLLGEDLETRKKIAADISKIYNIRSKVVHTGAIIANENIAELAGWYAREILKKLIILNSEYDGNFDSFIKMIDEKKYS